MNGIAIDRLIETATTVGRRAGAVQSDPAVRRAVVEAVQCLVAARKAVGTALFEIQSAWNRSALATATALAA